MQSHLVKKLKSLAFICLFTCFAGVLYQLINERSVDFRSVIVGFPLGLAFGLMEVFLFPRIEMRFRRWSFTKIVVFKTVVYTAVIYMVSLIIGLIAGLLQGRRWSELAALLTSTEQLVLVVYALVVYGLLAFLLQVNHLLGEGVLWKFIRGKYHRPREEDRVFMFLDMKSSTMIAEQLGHVRFYELLNEVFHEISQPVLQTSAEIYQYVGDEVVLTWKADDGLENWNCLNTFFMFRERLLNNTGNYLSTYGVRPQFKAGLHCGKVVTAQIGDLKREIVYNGDVLNTTARIRNECNTYQRDCLVSGALMNRLKHSNRFQWEKLDTVTLRGKEKEVELFSVSDTLE